MGYSKVNVHDLEPAGPGGAIRFVRRELDLLAFGINWFEIRRTATDTNTTSRNRARRRSI
jgi:hypothetical protein